MSALRPLHVLVVEDQALLVQAQVACLTARGHRVTTAASVAEALRTLDVDVVVSDLGLPLVSGLELLAEVRASRPELPVILTSGAFGDEEREAAESGGAFRWLAKPFPLHELVEAVEAAGSLPPIERPA